MGSKELSEKLAAAGVRELPRDPRLMSEKDLRELFGAKTSGRIVLSKLMRSVIWFVREGVRRGEIEPSRGNLRTFWYRWLKPVLSHIPDDDHARTDPYEVMLKAFGDLVSDLGVMRYSDLDLTDENFHQRFISPDRPGVLVFAEKTGLMRLLRRVHKNEGVSVLATGGAPSALTSEYTADLLKETWGDKGLEVHLVGIVDFDPAGQHIAQALVRQLEGSGLNIASLTTLIHPQHYTPEELEIFAFPLPNRQKTKNAKWLAAGGGLDGRPYGLEAESMPPSRLEALLHDVLSTLPPH